MTNNKTPLKIVLLSLAGFLVVCALILSNSKYGKDASTTLVEPKNGDNPNNLAADMTVTMDRNAFGCEFLNQYSEAISHYLNNETKAFSKTIGAAPSCFTSDDWKGWNWKVLEIRGPIMRIELDIGHKGKGTAIQSLTWYEVSKRSYWTQTTWGAKVDARNLSPT